MLTFLFYFVLLFLSPVLCHIEYLFSIFNKLYYYYYYYIYEDGIHVILPKPNKLIMSSITSHNLINIIQNI